MLPLFLILSLLIIPTVPRDHFDNCDPSCHFSAPLFTQETIKNWPMACEKVCGDLNFNSSSNLTEKQLTTVFGNLQYLIGNLRIENTSFKSLNFLSSLMKISSSSSGVFISFNSQLKNFDVLSNVASWNPSIWHIHDNPKLDFSPFCRIGLENLFIELDVYGNLRDCGCQAVFISPASLPYYSNCTTIIGGGNKGLKISGVNQSMDLSPIRNLKNLTSLVEVYGTSLENLSFLENIETIGLEASNAYSIIYIRNNPKLKRLGFESLKKMTPKNGDFIMNISNNHPDLCLSTNELQVLAQYMVDLRYDFLSICSDLSRKNGEKVCIFDDLNTMDAGCLHIIGDIFVTSENEKSVWKLENVTNVYGSVTVEDTEEIEDLKFLARLRQVADVKFDIDKPMIRINYNRKLQSVSFPSMTIGLYPHDADQFIEIYGNSMDIFKSQRDCLLLQKLSQTSVKYNKKSCDKLPTVTQAPSTSSNYTDDFIYDTDTLNKGHLDNRDFLFSAILIDTYKSIITHLKTIYNISAVISLLVNLPHLLILSQKPLRANLVYIVMIGICLSDLVHSIGKIAQILNTWDFVDVCPGTYPYYYIIIDILSKCSQIMSRRTSGFLALFIAWFRAFSVIFPMSNIAQMSSYSGFLIVFIIMSICTLWSSLYYFTTIISKAILCPSLLTAKTPSWVMWKHDTFGRAEGILRVIDGYMALVVSLLYVLVAAMLVGGIARARKRRRSLKEEKSSNTSTLVIMMAIFMLLSESTYGSLFLLSSFLFVDFEERTYFEELEVFAMTLSMINSIAHCFICFLMSSQYRDVIKDLFSFKKIEKLEQNKSNVESSIHPTSLKLTNTITV